MVSRWVHPLAICGPRVRGKNSDEFRYETGQVCNSCGAQPAQTQQPQPPQANTAIPTNLQIGLGRLDPQTYTFSIGDQWSSSTGNRNDLAKCAMGEYVIYPGSSREYQWPSPMQQTSKNPTSVATANAGAGSSIDRHMGPDKFTKPYVAASFKATQYLTYDCPGGSGRMGPITITRSVSQDSKGAWQYGIKVSFGSTVRVAAAPLP